MWRGRLPFVMLTHANLEHPGMAEQVTVIRMLCFLASRRGCDKRREADRGCVILRGLTKVGGNFKGSSSKRLSLAQTLHVARHLTHRDILNVHETWNHCYLLYKELRTRCRAQDANLLLTNCVHSFPG